MKNQSVPFARSYWVEPGKLLAGCYPGAKNSKEAEAKLGGLLASGIRLVINLMEEDEFGHDGEPFVPYEEILQRMAKKIGTEVECVRIPIPDLTAPAPGLMVKVLDRIDQAISQQKPVYVHCWGGKGRTGTVVGCYLVRHGIAFGEDVLKRIEQFRRNDPKAHERSPETPDQRAMVKHWKRGK